MVLAAGIGERRRMPKGHLPFAVLLVPPVRKPDIKRIKRSSEVDVDVSLSS
jgi:hypothetical protein